MMLNKAPQQMSTQSPLLKINNLHVAFKTELGLQHVVHGIDLELACGETLAIVGESGSGKSVTAQSIIQVYGPSGCLTQGEIIFDGEMLHTMRPKQMRGIRGKKIGMIFQDPMTALNPTMRIGQQIAEMLVYHDGATTAQARVRTLELLEHVGIAEPATRYSAYPFQLSGGMRQRVMIAMAIACCPLLLIADEPTTALDVTIQAQILDLLQKCCREFRMSLLLITHDLGVVAGVCDRIAVMQHGKIVETADVHSLFYAPKHPYTQALLNARGEIAHA